MGSERKIVLGVLARELGEDVNRGRDDTCK